MIDPLIARAFAHHQAGERPQAEALYREVLASAPDDLNGLQLLGLLVLDSGRAAEAAELIGRAVAVVERNGGVAPRHAALFNNLGNALRAAGRGGEAVAAYRRGVALDPGLAELHANLAVELLAEGEPLAATAACEASLRLCPDNPEYLCTLGNCRAVAGRGDEAVAAYLAALKRRPGWFDALSNLGQVLVALGRLDDAERAFAAAVAVNPAAGSDAARSLTAAGGLAAAARLLAPLAAAAPGDVGCQRRLAEACFTANLPEPALAAFTRVAELDPSDAEARYAIGRLHHVRGAVAEAEAGYVAALALQPGHVMALSNLAVLLQDRGRHAEVVEVCSRLLAVLPEHAGALCVLGAAYSGLGNALAAIDAYVRSLRLNPGLASANFNLGVLLSRMGRMADAIVWLERAAALKPDDASVLVELGNVLQSSGQAERARACFRRAQQLRPLATWPAATGKADFAVLVLMAPGAGNTPAAYLLGKANYDAHFYGLLAGTDPDLDLLRSHCDVVVNMISDVDQGGAILPMAAAVIDRLGKPVINHPARIPATGREAVAQGLAGIAHCRVPRTERFTGARLLSPAAAAPLAAFPWPFLVRLAGTHGGDEFEMVAGVAEVAAVVGRNPDADYYVTEFVDYHSADGYFRKYRLIFVGDEILPYHLAIGDRWKIHHFRTDMEHHPWMQREEEAFLRDPGRVFGPLQMAALRAIQAAVGLEFFGIDCSLDHAGDVVVFEVNATMLVHGDNTDLPYKEPYVARIKRAFDAMLERGARGRDPG